jgi:pimeloyl-ACP methyl ester carboxylesterase
VESSIPALLLAGDFDPITPPDWGRLAAEGLSQSYFYTFPANGHWVTRSSLCALSVAFAFWDDPTAEPDSTCIADIRGLNYLK